MRCWILDRFVRQIAVAGCLACVAAVGCSSDLDSGEASSNANADAVVASELPPVKVKKLPDLGHIHNVHEVGERVLTGSQPENIEDFKALKSAGVSVVVSVDGTPPDLTSAREAGLKYVHIPLGYHGISREQQLGLARVLKDYPAEKIFFHCQHGKHRGPAAAATACQMTGVLTGEQAREYLESAGTSADYVGLWKAAAESQGPQADEVLPELRESVEPPEMVMMMKDIEAQFRNSKVAATQVADAPDVFRQSNALLNQLFKESARLPSADSIKDELTATGVEVLKLNESLPTTTENALQGLAAIEQRCTRCHASHRQ